MVQGFRKLGSGESIVADGDDAVDLIETIKEIKRGGGWTVLV